MKMNPASPMNAFPPHSVMQPMKKTSQHSLLFVAVCAALLHLAAPAARAADANPPGKLTYQGFLTDASGVPLGNGPSINTNITFRIYTAATGGTLKWSESQVVTLDKGHFSVLLGEGSAVAGETAAYTNNLSGIFTGVDASDRFMQISVGAGIIAPRLQFLPAPYALLARSANQVVSPAGANILSVIANGNVGINNASPVSALDVGGTVTATAFSGNGALLSAINAAAVTSGTLNNARTTATDANTASAIVARDASGNFTAGAITATTFTGNGAALTALTAANLSGTVQDARLSSNVGLRAGGNAFTGNQTVAGNLGIGTNAPTASLHVVGTVSMFKKGVVVFSGQNTSINREGVATTDGFLSITIALTGGDESANTYGTIDNVLMGAASISHASGTDFPIYNNGFMMPVPKGATWKLVSYARDGRSSMTIMWTALGQ